MARARTVDLLILNDLRAIFLQSPFAVILSAAKDLALPLRLNYAKNLALLAQGKLLEGSRSVFSRPCEILPSHCSGPLLLLRMTAL
jgi:hypothetical protein